ncbi:glycosyltransferase [Streptacidiphilus monticola]|uniref:D-inositol 3-phosphate glycosyltransferase n=1 Tax=Streptacidiphilus monticola TaxID=2161674 RepID=A0ABW1G9X9_9ACTN
MVRGDTRGAEPGHVCFAAQDWWYHSRAHSDVQLMLHVARHRPVLFVNSIGMRMPLPGRSSKVLRRLLRKARSMARSLAFPVPELPRFAVLSPVVLPFYGWPTARAVNARLVAFQVRRAARKMGMRPDVVTVTVPTAVDAVRRLPHRTLVYNRSDRHSAFPEADQAAIAGLEQRLLREAAVVLYVSRELLAAEEDVTDGRAVFLDHGVDLDRFTPDGPEAAELSGVPHPRAGFFGALDDFVVDLALLERLAKERPDTHLVLVGGGDADLSGLAALPNVHLFGFQPHEAVPAFGRGFDVGLMPWHDNDWVRHCNPVKLKEYLALGLPVVSTDFPELRRYAEAGVAAASTDAESFLAAVDRALSVPPAQGAEERRAFVAADTWEARAQEFLRAVEGTPA